MRSANRDLNEIFDWIAASADRHAAYAYTSAIEERVDRLAATPKGGTPRDHLLPGLRSVTYRRRTIIFYQIKKDHIEIVRLAHGGRNLQTIFPDDD